MDNVIRIENWSVRPTPGDNDPYTPPEFVPKSLVGNVYGHHRHEDGKSIVTSTLVKAEGRIVTTRGGSVYRLGEIDPDYRKWLRENYPDWDWKNPIKTGD